jgi:hypothetical protein
MQRTSGGIVIGVALAIALAAPAAAQGPAITEVVGGLNSPRGVAIGADGTIYVAEAGAGGTEPCVTHAELGNFCLGASGTITAVSGGEATALVDGLASGITDVGEAIGPSDVSVDADGTVWFLVGGPAAGSAEFREAIPDGAGAGMGQLYFVDADGVAQSVADLADYETTVNPDAEQPGNAEPDSNIHGLAATPDGAAIADAGGNTLLLVDAEAAISTLAVFPIVMQPLPAELAPPPDPDAEPDPNAEPPMVPMDPVPTSVALGDDGALYVGQLTGFPFPPGGAAVLRVAPGEEPSVYADGFTNVIDVEFASDGSLYVLELAHEGLLSAGEDGPPMGGLWKVPAGGGDAELIVSDGLPMPGGLAVADDGTVYISTCTGCPPGAGGLVSVQP